MNRIVVIGCGTAMHAVNLGIEAALAMKYDIEYDYDMERIPLESLVLEYGEFDIPRMLKKDGLNNPQYRQIEFKGKHKKNKRT